jgi:ATP-dependent protease ClpP protease subunit
MTREPLWDLAGRTLCLGYEVSNTIEGLLRLQNTADYQRPISLYIYGSASMPAPLPTDAMLVCGLIRILRSPVQTIGMGLLQQTQALVLAAGTHHRCLIRHTLLAMSPIKWDAVAAARNPIGLNHRLPHSSPHAMLQAQLEQLLSELSLDPHWFQTEQLLTAEQAVDQHFAEAVVATAPSQLPPNPEPTHETQH